MKRSFSTVLAVTALLGFTLLAPLAYGQGASAGGSVATKENLDLPFDAIGDSEDEEDAPEIIVFYGQQYEGDGIFFCCDKSSSMEGQKFAVLQKEVIKNVSSFSDKVQFGIVFFDAGLWKFPPSGRPAEANPAMKAAASSFVMSTATGHGTCAKAALVTALAFANQSTSKRRLIIHLSDGQNWCNGQDPSTYGPTVLTEVTAKNTSGVHINAICIGPAGGDVNEDWMRKLAAQNNGAYARIVQ